MPVYSKRLKTHLVLHLVDNMTDFGPTECYNTERYEAFNSVVRAQNIYGNRHSPSKDIAYNFAVLQHLRFLCSGGYCDGRQCGEGLQHLYSSPQIQIYLNCLPTSEVLQEKQIYQPGCLRKLSHGTVPCKLLNVMTSMCYDTVPKSIEELMRHFGCSVHDLPETLSLESPILAFKAVMTQSKQIANIGDFVKVTSPRISIGILLACGRIVDNKAEVCLIRQLQFQNTVNGTPLLTEFDCPIAILTTNSYIVQTTSIHSPVSVLHVCSDTCKFASDTSIFTHDLTNNVFCYNVYCIGNN